MKLTFRAVVEIGISEYRKVNKYKVELCFTPSENWSLMKTFHKKFKILINPCLSENRKFSFQSQCGKTKLYIAMKQIIRCNLLLFSWNVFQTSRIEFFNKSLKCNRKLLETLRAETRSANEKLWQCNWVSLIITNNHSIGNLKLFRCV
jgi:hypothetical protein